MGKVVAFINGVPNLIYFDFKGKPHKSIDIYLTQKRDGLI